MAHSFITNRDRLLSDIITGIQGRTEINVRFTDKGKYTEGKQIFDELWANAIPIVDENTVDRWNWNIIAKNICFCHCIIKI